VLADTSRVRQVLYPVLVGREEQTSHLQTALAAAQTGRGGTVLVTGEGRIGRSRLIREIAHTARGRDFVVRPGGQWAVSRRRSGFREMAAVLASRIPGAQYASSPAPAPGWIQARLGGSSQPPDRSEVTVGFTGTLIIGVVSRPDRLRHLAPSTIWGRPGPS